LFRLLKSPLFDPPTLMRPSALPLKLTPLELFDLTIPSYNLASIIVRYDSFIMFVSVQLVLCHHQICPNLVNLYFCLSSAFYNPFSFYWPQIGSTNNF